MIVQLGGAETKAAIRRYEQHGRVPPPAVRAQLVTYADQLQRELDHTRAILKACDGAASKTANRRARRKVRRLPK